MDQKNYSNVQLHLLLVKHAQSFTKILILVQNLHENIYFWRNKFNILNKDTMVVANGK